MNRAGLKVFLSLTAAIVGGSVIHSASAAGLPAGHPPVNGSFRGAEAQGGAIPPDVAVERFKSFASGIETSDLEEIPVQSHGRIKPLQTLARETVLFLTGRYSKWGLDPIQIYLGLVTSDAAPYLEVINIRDTDLRQKLGFLKSERELTLAQLEESPLQALAQPVMAKEKRNDKSVTPEEKKILEAMQQVWVMREVTSGSHFFQALILDPTHLDQQSPVIVYARQLLKAIASGDTAAARGAASGLSAAARAQPMPEVFRRYLGKLGAEVFYNKAHLFLWVAILYIVIGLVLASGTLKKRVKTGPLIGILLLPLIGHALGFGLRVYITGFAPVTNMYGTMIWMAFGVALFAAVLFVLYRNPFVTGLLLLGSGATLLLSESMPLVLSPDLDPVVAVLRNNFWLTVHVLTITLSYGAFTVAMLIGNGALVRTLVRGKQPPSAFKDLAHLAYRAMQLGVFLLTTGIILGGWWADYSWGRFWGWDPKETWALIADLGFLAILHAKYLGWLDSFGTLAAAPFAYLLVIMAWYGVNFILAAGLHSYGFSSGGAAVVAVFVSLQVVLSTAAILKHSSKATSRKRMVRR